MKKFEILEHTADLKIRVFGKIKEELFRNALFAMMECLKAEVQAGVKEIKKEIKISSQDTPSLLVDFLSEVLYLTQVNKEVYNNMRFIKFSDTELEAELQGKKVERFGEDIKAVTYHGLEIRQAKNKTWDVILLFDI